MDTASDDANASAAASYVSCTPARWHTTTQWICKQVNYQSTFIFMPRAPDGIFQSFYSNHVHY